jgi:hypothetical protein
MPRDAGHRGQRVLSRLSARRTAPIQIARTSREAEMRTAPGLIFRRSEAVFLLVDDTGIEPATSSVSACAGPVLIGWSPDPAGGQ